eukprot:scaffold8182_cov120-Isochrysis_galbana.AAC.2
MLFLAHTHTHPRVQDPAQRRVQRTLRRTAGSCLRSRILRNILGFLAIRYSRRTAATTGPGMWPQATLCDAGKLPSASGAAIAGHTWVMWPRCPVQLQVPGGVAQSIPADMWVDR